MIILIIARILDIVTTLINTNKWGYSVEGNFIMRQIIEKGLFIPYQMFMIGFIILIAEIIPKYKRIIYISVSVLSLITSVNNLFCYFFIK
jgi:putative exporter of polyketide antibiotics